MKIKSHNPLYSISARIGLIAGICIIILSVGLAVLIGRQSALQVKRDANASLAELAFQMSDKTDRGIDERYSDVFAAINSQTFHSPTSTVVQKKNSIDNLSKTYPEYSFLGFADETGKVLASKDNLLLGQSVAARPWFQASLKTPQNKLVVEDVHEALLLSRLLPPDPTGEPLRFIDIAGPVYDTNNKLTGVFGAHLSFKWIDDIRTSLIRPTENRDKVDVIVLASDNKVLLGPSDLEGKTLNVKAATQTKPGTNSSTDEVWLDGTRYLTGVYGSKGYNNYPGLGWKILVRQPTTVAYHQSQQLQQKIAAIGVIAGLFAAVIVWILLSRITRSIRSITKAAASINDGNLTSALPRLKGSDELSVLSTTLAEMVQTLTAKKKLEGQNADLERLNAALVDRELKMVQLKQEIQQLRNTHDDKKQ